MAQRRRASSAAAVGGGEVDEAFACFLYLVSSYLIRRSLPRANLLLLTLTGTCCLHPVVVSLFRTLPSPLSSQTKSVVYPIFPPL